MNLRLIPTLSGVLLILLVLLAGCQPEDSLVPQNSPGQKLSSRSDLTCGTACGEITTADLIRSTGPNAGDDVGDVTVQNDGSNLCILIMPSGTITIDDAAIYVGACNLLPVNSGNGNFSFGNFLYQYPGNGFVLSDDEMCMTLTIPIPEGECYCVAIRVALSGGPAWAQGDMCSSNGCNNGMAFEHCTQECDEVCYGPGETAWSDGDEFAEGGNWATFTAAGDFPVTLYAGQTLDAGTVSYDGTNITITLAAGWEFADVSENVKIQGYDVIPTEEPVPGQFENKTTAAIGSSPYSVAVDAANYYAVHVDLVPIVDCPELRNE